uniref:Si:dkey-184p18.2 n=2 Tax=Gasterosteus aculeatus TaxID=69293 RepID=A0AAQ4R564_GASAC
MKIKTEETSDRFLLDASWLYRDTCPELSRFLLQGTMKANAQANQNPPCLPQSTSVCPYCYQWLQPDNHRMRLRPKQRPSARVQSVLRRKARGKRLGLVQQNLLQRFQTSSSVLKGGGTLYSRRIETQLPGASGHLSRSEMAAFVSMATCHTCSKTSRHKGMNRDFIATLAKTPTGTPGSAAKHKTPQSSHRANMTTPKNAGRDRTPAHTPRSSSSFNTSGSGSSSSKTPIKPKNWLVQSLGKILMREGRQSSKKVGLKDFLSSL